MTTQSMSTHSEDRLPESASRRIRVRRRSAEALARTRDHAPAPGAASPDRPDDMGQAGGVGRARVLRRWSVADLIARAGAPPRAIA
jgi:hypothetical protein